MTFARIALLALAALLHTGPLPASQARGVAPHPAAHPQRHQVSTADWQFMRRAAALGHGAVSAAHLAASHARDPAVRDFGGVLAGEHSTLDQRLALLSLATQVPLPTRAPQEDRKALGALKLLSGSAFDVAFVREVGVIQRQVVLLFEAEAVAQAGDPALRSLAREYLPRLQAEARLLHDLQAAHPAPSASSPG
jgi:putative membrane protein